MRLIDADAFADFLKNIIKTQKYDALKVNDTLTVEDVLESVIAELDGTSLDGFKNNPTIEPQLDEWCNDCKEYDKERHCCPRWNRVIRTTLDDVRKEAYEQGRAMAQRWIPVTERLPEKYKDVLCCYEYFRYGDYNCMFRTIDRGYYGNGVWGGEAGQGHKNKVLAWMPLPEPFKGEQK